MGLIEILWTIAAVIVPTLLGTAWAMVGLTPPEFWIARGCICVAAFIFTAVALTWLAMSQSPNTVRILIGAFLGVAAFIGFSEALRLVNARENLLIDKRADLRTKLQQFYIDVGPIITRNLSKNISDSDFDKYVGEVDTWATNTANWIDINMGMPARERFLDRTGMLTLSYSAAINEKHNSIINNLTRLRQNLLILIESSAWDKR